MDTDPAIRAAMMYRAVGEALRAAGRTSPNPVVGCVVARGATVLGSGYHTEAGADHAEVVALRNAGDAARGADVYVTLEPCNHHGRTPPCTEALIAAGVERVFIGIRDPHPLVDGRGIKRLQEAGLYVEVGLLEEECRRANEAFVHFIRYERPFVTAKIAQSLDGRVATVSGKSKWITGEAARNRGHELRNSNDAILVGVGTVLADDPQLSCRIEGGRDPIRVIADSRARTPPSARLLAGASAAETWIAVSVSAPESRVRRLEAAGAKILRCSGRERIDFSELLYSLGVRGVLSVLLEGGPTVIGEAVNRRLVDKLYLFQAPIIIGGRDALGSVGGAGADSPAEAFGFKVSSRETLGNDVLTILYPR